LIAAFDRAKFFSLKDRYSERADGCPGGVYTDATSAQISITLNGKSKSVFHYHGCVDQNREPYPAELYALAAKIDELVNTKQWVNIDDAEQLVGRERRGREAKAKGKR
jgi:hypothetical protein